MLTSTQMNALDIFKLLVQVVIAFQSIRLGPQYATIHSFHTFQCSSGMDTQACITTLTGIASSDLSPEVIGCLTLNLTILYDGVERFMLESPFEVSLLVGFGRGKWEIGTRATIHPDHENPRKGIQHPISGRVTVHPTNSLCRGLLTSAQPATLSSGPVFLWVQPAYNHTEQPVSWATSLTIIAWMGAAVVACECIQFVFKPRGDIQRREHRD